MRQQNVDTLTERFDLVGVQEVSNLLDGVAEERPALVMETVPVRVELGELARLVRMLLRDGLPAGDLGPLLEALAARPSAASRDPAALARAVRPAYRRWLSVRARGDEPDAEPLLVWSLDEPLTLACEEAGRRPDADGEPRLDPALVEDLRAAAAAALPAGERSLLMTTAGALRPAQRALGPGWAHVLVLGPEDLDAAVVLEPAGTLQAPE